MLSARVDHPELPDPMRGSHTFELYGTPLQALRSGALWWPDEATLVVSDLHLEKGSAYIRRGVTLPPYDTRATLKVIETLVAELKPQRVISLGDSFHDLGAADRLGADDHECLSRLIAGVTEWHWIEGNHDPAPPENLGGLFAHELKISKLTFRHIPGDNPQAGEVAGHLHPCAKVIGGVRALRHKAFITDGSRLVMPALGAFTGGLNVRDPAVSGHFPKGYLALVLGRQRITPVAPARLGLDT
jgi:uncharacterized protein